MAFQRTDLLIDKGQWFQFFAHSLIFWFILHIFFWLIPPAFGGGGSGRVGRRSQGSSLVSNRHLGPKGRGLGFSPENCQGPQLIKGSLVRKLPRYGRLSWSACGVCGRRSSVSVSAVAGSIGESCRQKSAQDCVESPMCISKNVKSLDDFGALLEQEVGKMCTGLLRELGCAQESSPLSAPRARSWIQCNTLVMRVCNRLWQNASVMLRRFWQAGLCER